MRITRVRNQQRKFDQLDHELRMETISAVSVLVQLMLLISEQHELKMSRASPL